MNVEIAGRLASRRRDAGFSQEALAERLGVTRQAVSKWERSESSPDTDNLIALATLYGVSLDELLNVNPALEDDIAFETADRAAKHSVPTQDDASQEAAVSQGESAQDTIAQDTTAQNEPTASSEDTASVSGEDTASASGEDTASASGDDTTDNAFFYDDDGDYVRINWRDGVHVKDAKTGEEVHVGWQGVDVKNPAHSVKRSHSWKNHHNSNREHRFSEDGPLFSLTIDECEDTPHHKREDTWHTFPFFLLVLIAYILWGFFGIDPLSTQAGDFSAWFYGLFLFALVPLYHLLLNSIKRRSPVRFIQGFYPLACVVFFLWMWLIEGAPHPTWVLILSIPIVEWICAAARRRSRRRRRYAEKELE